MRGHRRAAGRIIRDLGSIPACAGSPFQRLFSVITDEVYPRVCGVTAPGDQSRASIDGLSPRVRGHPATQGGDRHVYRSIPACAGSPSHPAGTPHHEPVYPRVCGVTPMCWGKQLQVRGLSPRVRGHHDKNDKNDTDDRSIPACAGSPDGRHLRRCEDTVYPRVCGVTCLPNDTPPLKWGLSPRVRGHPMPWGHKHHQPRSIPACAGSPAYNARMEAPL